GLNIKLVVHPSSAAHYIFIRTTRHLFIASSILLSVFSAVLIRSASNKISRRYSIQLSAILIFSLLSDFVLQILWNPILLFPIPCTARDHPIIDLPGSSDFYFLPLHNLDRVQKLWVTSFTQIAPAYLACALYRHQAVLLPQSRWWIRPSSQRMITAFLSILGLTMPILLHHLSPSFPSSIISTADCYDSSSLRPFGAMGAAIGSLSTVTSSMLVRHTRYSLRVASLLSERVRSHHMAMAIVPTLCVALPLSVVVSVLISEIDGSLILPHCLLVFSTHSFFQSVVLISTTPLYRKRLLQWLNLLKEPSTPADRVCSRQSDNVLQIQTIIR
ncbi:hypothetical protein PRIPAC_74054, partial [Pristionchus pacificus]|uniref:G protein-coupled receptor n=1 Tax=Pristionchus pacificus TaxID=54126 RepID=A0A2A6CGA8_PRIPA